MGTSHQANQQALTVEFRKTCPFVDIINDASKIQLLDPRGLYGDNKIKETALEYLSRIIVGPIEKQTNKNPRHSFNNSAAALPKKVIN